MSDKHIIEEAYKRFPDETEPSEHLLGKITVDRGNLRYAFCEGARFATSDSPADRKGEA